MGVEGLDILRVLIRTNWLHIIYSYSLIQFFIYICKCNHKMVINSLPNVTNCICDAMIKYTSVKLYRRKNYLYILYYNGNL